MKLSKERKFLIILVDFMEVGKIGTKTLSKLLFVPKNTEQSYFSMLNSISDGVFVGVSGGMSKPFFLNFDILVNPHVFVVGMTGSGKTFLVKNLMLKLYGCIAAFIFIIDFTGEYREFAELVKAESYTPEFFKRNINIDSKICYFSLENMHESDKLEKGREVLSLLVSYMRGRELYTKKRFFIIIDEAWKLLGSNSGIETIIREGRKYSTGIILASQLLDDIKLNALSNVASIFVFRTQNTENIEKLVLNYELPSHYLEKIKNLDVGSCIAIQIYKSGKRTVFQIKKVSGLIIVPKFGITFGDMMVELKQSTVEIMVKRLSKNDPTELISKIRSQKSISLYLLIHELIKLGSDRLSILSYLRSIGISEEDIADSYAAAIEVNLYEIK